MPIIYLDKLSFSSLFSLVLSGIKDDRIFFFNTSSKGEEFAKIFLKLKLLRTKPELAEFCLSNIRDDNGGCLYMKIVEDIKDICHEFSDKEFANSSFLKRFGKQFDYKKILLFFEKALSERINDTIVFLNAAVWHAKKELNKENNDIIFFIEKDLWSKYLLQYASKLEIRVIEYRLMLTSYLGLFSKATNVLFSRIKSRLKMSEPDNNSAFQNKGLKYPFSNSINQNKPFVASWYTGKTVTFDLKKRSDLFWLLKSDIPKEQVLMYFDREDIPVSEEMRMILNNERINILALSASARTSEAIPLWKLSEHCISMRKRFFAQILANILKDMIRLRPVPLFYVSEILFFVWYYSYWHDFFKSNGIKININPRDFAMLNVPMNLALEKNGGVSISYHWSHLYLNSAVLSSCADVLFSFGPDYFDIWDKNRSRFKSLIYCGYVTDYSFKEVKEDSARLRSQLKEKGVKFIICFFDENSSNDRMCMVSNKTNAETYGHFLRKVLEDETLGLIIKPGYPKTLYQRISSVKYLIDKAKATGRCVFMEKGSYVTEQYPTEAAQAADLCVGLLFSGAAAIESYLSGTPTVFLDLEHIYSNPLYQCGKEKVVFDNLNDLFSAVKKYRENPESVPGFGDLSSWVKGKDPFKDGNASLRIGEYLNWLLECFNNGKTREEALEYANRKYAQNWGEENVVRSKE